MNLKTLAELYHYLDELVNQECSDNELFTSSYLRGFIALSASEFGDEEQLLTKAFAERVSAQLKAARKELSPDDRVLVENYWLELSTAFSAE